MTKPTMAISICTYTGGDFEVMIRDKETDQEIMLRGNQKVSPEEFDLLNKLAPACVWTPYTQQ